MLVIRPMTGADRERVIEGFASLSPASRRLRFFTPTPELSTAQKDELTRVDPSTRVVLLAFDADTGTLVGGVRAVRFRDDPRAAEVAITVGDAWQGRGVGRQLLAALVPAAERAGIEHLTGDLLAENRAAAKLLSSAGARLTFGGSGTLHFDIPVQVPVAA